MKNKLKPTIVLVGICLVVALILSSVNFFTKPVIEKSMEEKANRTLKEVLPLGEEFSKMDLEEWKLPCEITKMYKETSGKGYVFEVTVTGYKPGLVIMCGIDEKGVIRGATYIASSETLQAEVGLGEHFVSKTKSTLNPDTVSHSTAKLTVNAYYRAVELALDAFEIVEKGKE